MQITLEDFILNQNIQVSLTDFIINMLITATLSGLLAYTYTKLGKGFSDRKVTSSNFIYVAMTTMLIITIVKSSLALSLGLVGALSIVRFRTPIKEPEELAYLFIAIAMGLGLGANQTVPTVLGSFVILLAMAFFKWTRRDSQNKNLHNCLC